jgi:hypothetical protein
LVNSTFLGTQVRWITLYRVLCIGLSYIHVYWWILDIKVMSICCLLFSLYSHKRRNKLQIFKINSSYNFKEYLLSGIDIVTTSLTCGLMLWSMLSSHGCRSWEESGSYRSSPKPCWGSRTS